MGGNLPFEGFRADVVYLCNKMVYKGYLTRETF